MSTDQAAHATWHHLRQSVVVFLVVYGTLCFLNPDTYRLLDSVDLAIHETGHIVFAPFGEFLGMLGGTLFQLIVPAAFVAYFWRRGDRFAAAVVLFWVAQNCLNIARYAADARAQELPLVGGGEHDWTYLLLTMNWLEHDQTVGALFRFIGFFVFIASVWLAWRYSAVRAPADVIASET
jgi:hypothetical protein